MIYNNYPDDYIVINAKWVEWDNDNECWCFMTEDAFEKAQPLSDYTKQVRKEVCEEIRTHLLYLARYNEQIDLIEMDEFLDQIQNKD